MSPGEPTSSPTKPIPTSPKAVPIPASSNILILEFDGRVIASKKPGPEVSRTDMDSLVECLFYDHQHPYRLDSEAYFTFHTPDIPGYKGHLVEVDTEAWAEVLPLITRVIIGVGSI